jgi:uncharacterized protein YcfL
MHLKRLSLLVAAGLAVAVAGCSTGGGARLPVNSGKYNQELNAKFVLMDDSVQRSVTCSALQERALPDGRLEVTAVMRNRETRRIQVQVQCVFKDAQGISTGDETPWKDVILTENAMENATFASINAQAKTYTVRVRQSR